MSQHNWLPSLILGTAAMAPPFFRSHDCRTSGTGASQPGRRHGTVRAQMYDTGSAKAPEAGARVPKREPCFSSSSVCDNSIHG